MSEQLSHRPPEAEINNRIEDQAVAEVAAYATKEQEEQMRQVGSMALMEYGDALAGGDLDGANRLLNNRKEEVQQLRNQADTTTERIVNANQALEDTINSPRPGIVEIKESSEEKSPYENIRGGIEEVSEDIYGKIKQGERRLRDEQGIGFGELERSATIDFSLVEPEAGSENDSRTKEKAFREQLTLTIADFLGLEVSEDFDGMDFMLDVQDSPEKLTKQDITDKMIIDIAETLPRVAEAGYKNISEAVEDITATGKINVKDIKNAAEAVYKRLIGSQ